MTRPIDAIVLGLSPTGLYASRELARAGLRVLGADAAAGCASRSNTLASCWHIADDDALLQRLADLATGQAQPPLLLPASDRYIAFLGRHAGALRAACLFPDGYDGLYADLLDKQRFHALCLRHGMRVPRVWSVRDRAGLASMAAQIAFPCILKPTLIHRARAALRGNKVLLARTPAELDAAFARVPGDVGGWLVQEVIPGAESHITLFAGYVGRDGEMRQAFTARKLRQYPPGFGSASLAISETCEETAALSSAFARAIGLRGIFGAEFKRDPRDGQLTMIEINPRPTLWFQLVHAAGKRIAEAAWRDLRDVAPAPDRPQRDGVRWRYALKDLTSALFYRRHGDDFVFPPPDLQAAGAHRSAAWAVYDPRDPLPALAEIGVYLEKLWKRRQ